MLRQAEADIGSASARVTQAGSSRLPQVDAGGLAKQGLSGSASLFALNGLANSPEPDDLASSVNLGQDLLDFGRSKFETRAREAELDYYRKTLLAVEAQLVLDVQVAYFSVLKAQKRAGLAERSVNEKRLSRRRAEALEREHLGSKMESDEAGADLARSRLVLATARDDLNRSWARLNALLGRDPSATSSLQGPQAELADPEPLEALVDGARSGRPEIAAVEARIRAAGEWVRRAEREKYPRLMMMFSGGWARFAELSLGRLLFGGFGIRLPLLTGGRLKASIEEARQGVEKTKAARDELLRAVTLEVATSRSAVAAAQEAVRSAEKGLAPARGAQRLASLRYENGLGSRLEWMRTQTALASAEDSHWQSVCDLRIAEARLARAVGAGPS